MINEYGAAGTAKVTPLHQDAKEFVFWYLTRVLDVRRSLQTKGLRITDSLLPRVFGSFVPSVVPNLLI